MECVQSRAHAAHGHAAMLTCTGALTCACSTARGREGPALTVAQQPARYMPPLAELAASALASYDRLLLGLRTDCPHGPSFTKVRSCARRRACVSAVHDARLRHGTPHLLCHWLAKRRISWCSAVRVGSAHDAALAHAALRHELTVHCSERGRTVTGPLRAAALCAARGWRCGACARQRHLAGLGGAVRAPCATGAAGCGMLVLQINQHMWHVPCSSATSAGGIVQARTCTRKCAHRWPAPAPGAGSEL